MVDIAPMAIQLKILIGGLLIWHSKYLKLGRTYVVRDSRIGFWTGLKAL